MSRINPEYRPYVPNNSSLIHTKQRPSSETPVGKVARRQLGQQVHAKQPISSLHVLSKTVANATTASGRSFFTSLINLIRRIFRINIHSSNNLLKSHEKIESSQQAWLLNLALMRDAASTLQENSLEKKQIEFMAANYLHKTAPIHMKTMKLFFKKIQSMFQTGGYENKEDNYHRFSLSYQMKLASKKNKALALGNKSPLILTDTIDFDHLLKLKFNLIAPKKGEEFDGSILAFLKSNDISKGSIASPLLFDLTGAFKDDIVTTGNQGKERNFKEKLNKFKSQLDRDILKAVDQLIVDSPSLKKQKRRLVSLIKKNTTCICRIETDGITGMKVLPLYSKISRKNIHLVHHDLSEFIISSGIGIGAVSMRRDFLDAFQRRKDVRYNIHTHNNTNPVVRHSTFEDKDCIIKSNIFVGLSKKINRLDSKIHPHVKVLGEGTIDLLKGLFSKVDEKKWEECMARPGIGHVFKTTVTKIIIQLGAADSHLGNLDEISQKDFNEFAQQIELLHAEIATLLEIFKPYNDNDFELIYKKNLLPNIPEAQHDNLKAGLGKTSVNVYAGINEAVSQLNPNPERVYSKGFYFEQAGFIGYDKTFESVMKEKGSNGKRVDLYSGQFNSNIEIDSNFTHYERRDIAKDIRELLDSGKASENLTVAIDCTIDQYNSSNAKDLVDKFQNEINEGKVNFIFFRSGQKMDMLGMDNYYGAPFYMVNNGDPKWKPFDKLREHPVHQTDPLSNQWFCLSNEFIPKSLESYRKLIYSNSRSILNNVPGLLKPNSQKDQKVRVNTVDDKMSPCFLDMKIKGHGHGLRAITLIGKFYMKMLEKGIKLQTRATFGLYHPNGLIISVNEVPDSTTIRLHPGLNPKENEAFKEYFEDIAKRLN